MATLKTSSASSSSSMVVLKVTLVALLIMVMISGMGTQAVEADSCGDQLKGLMKECTKYVLFLGPKKAPSESCCAVVKKADQGCVCDHVTPALQAIINMNKAVYVANCCGRNVPSGTHCGSYTVPGNW